MEQDARHSSTISSEGVLCGSLAELMHEYSLSVPCEAILEPFRPNDNVEAEYRPEGDVARC